MGATGIVGQRFIQLLEGHPWFELSVLAASGKSAGRRYRDVVHWTLSEAMPDDAGEMIIGPIDAKIFKREGCGIVFSALPAEVARTAELKLASAGLNVFSNASAFRMAQNVPLLIADINAPHLALVEQQSKARGGFIVTNPNCTVTGLATGLAPLKQGFGIKHVVVSTYQALSGAGFPGVSSMDIQGNIMPYIPGEEEKVEMECKKILGEVSEEGVEPLDFGVIASCARVPVRDGHLQSIVVELNRNFTLEETKKAFAEFKGTGEGKLPTAPGKPLVVSGDEARPQPLLDRDCDRGMAVTVGRMKKDQNKLRFFLLVHNTVRGAAGCSIMNAELAKVKDHI